MKWLVRKEERHVEILEVYFATTTSIGILGGMLRCLPGVGRPYENGRRVLRFQHEVSI